MKRVPSQIQRTYKGRKERTRFDWVCSWEALEDARDIPDAPNTDLRDILLFVVCAKWRHYIDVQGEVLRLLQFTTTGVVISILFEKLICGNTETDKVESTQRGKKTLQRPPESNHRSPPPIPSGRVAKRDISKRADMFIGTFSDCNDCRTPTEIVDYMYNKVRHTIIWAPSSEFVSSSIPSWQILTAHAQPFRGARDLAFCLKVPLDSLLVWASSEGSGETARIHRLAWTFAARIGDKYQIRLTRSNSVISDKEIENIGWFAFLLLQRSYIEIYYDAHFPCW